MLFTYPFPLPPPIFVSSFLALLSVPAQSLDTIFLSCLLFFARAPFLFPFLFGALSVLRPGRQSAARFGRRCKHLENKKSYFLFADARTPLSERTGRPTTRTRTRSKTMWNRIFSWKPVLQGFVSQLRSLMLKDFVAT